ncbi:hypothetical protein VP01_335g4 [Puccinia sorghi]|uniref:Uncharacterized protein n=1 Tax=Puccinia sorghi TaxID=27349 RepID=A0A0L6UYU2_9BASI|nr:hypothetical protein VP01_335g4 [Puccinia sorghi]
MNMRFSGEWDHEAVDYQRRERGEVEKLDELKKVEACERKRDDQLGLSCPECENAAMGESMMMVMWLLEEIFMWIHADDIRHLPVHAHKHPVVLAGNARHLMLADPTKLFTASAKEPKSSSPNLHELPLYFMINYIYRTPSIGDSATSAHQYILLTGPSITRHKLINALPGMMIRRSLGAFPAKRPCASPATKRRDLVVNCFKRLKLSKLRAHLHVTYFIGLQIINQSPSNGGPVCNCNRNLVLYYIHQGCFHGTCMQVFSHHFLEYPPEYTPCLLHLLHPLSCHISLLPVPVPVSVPVCSCPHSQFLLMIPVPVPVLPVTCPVMSCSLSRPPLDLARRLSSCFHLNLLKSGCTQDEIFISTSEKSHISFSHPTFLEILFEFKKTDLCLVLK